MLGAVVIVVAAGAAFWMMGARVATAPDGIVCTADVKLCADGSYVSRSGPACEFAACPEAPETKPVSVEAALGETVNGLGVSITPLAVVEDSRCPADVQCIQAGTVRLSARVVSGLGTSTPEFKLGQPITTETESITLTAVAPQSMAGVAIPDTAYVFTFEVTKRPTTFIR